MTPTCRRTGCYMFAPGTPERAACKRACRLERPHPRPSAAGIVLALLAVVGGGG